MITPIAKRLTPGTDLKAAIQAFVNKEKIQAGTILSCVGSLSRLHIRLAGATQTLTLEAPMEIVSLMATLTPEHQHIHISVADCEGKVIGGHLLEGNIIDTTGELIVAKFDQLHFLREYDTQTGFTELKIL